MTPRQAGALLLGLAVPLCAALAADPGAGGKPLVIGVSVPMADYPLYAEMKQAAEAEGVALGVTMEIADAHWSADRQLIDLERFVDRHVDGIVYSPVALAVLDEALDEAAAAGIPVVKVHAGKREGKVLAEFTADPDAGGRMAARFVIQRLGGTGEVIELVAMGPSWDEFRAALDEELRTSQVKVHVAEPTDLHRGEAHRTIAALLRDHRRFDAVVAVNDILALGAADALREAGIDPGSKVILGLDALPDGRRGVEEGVLTATLDPRVAEQTRQALRCLVEHLRTGKAPPAREVAVPPRLVTRVAQD